MSRQFVHLHFHSHYSLLDGAIKVKGLGPILKEKGFETSALTDHGNMFGAVEFHHEMNKSGIKPIVGMEAYVADGHRTNRKYAKPGPNAFHAVLLAQNRQGYTNLSKLSSIAFSEGKFYGRPRIDHELLAEYNEGIIVLSACLQGELARRLRDGKEKEAYEVAQWYKDTFPGRYYVELQANGIDIQNKVNPQLIKLARDLDIPLVGTNDCHYLTSDIAESHHLLQLMGWQKRVTDPGVKTLDTKELYVKTAEEMYQAFEQADLPLEALENTVKIAAQCELDLTNKKYYLPDYPVAEGRTLEEELIIESREGLQERLDKLGPLYGWDADEVIAQQNTYFTRLDFELKVINEMGFPGYFLIVSDFIKWAKNNGVPVGPGRGSGAGSIVAYSLKITDIDPIKFELLFERFLNPDRISMPDFDIDFEVEGRERVINYVRQKYGEKNVCQISAIGSLLAKGVLRGVARVLDIPYSDADEIAKLIPDELGITLDKAIEKEPKLKEMKEQGSEIEKKLLRHALALEGLNSNLSTHAAGVIIMNSDITDVMPTCTPTKGDAIQSQFTMKYAEDQGAVKFDFLGLKNLSVIDKATALVNRNRKPEDLLDITLLPMDDTKSFELLCRGDTTGVFQLESDGMKGLIQKLKPDCFEDIIALVALYRPGPLGSGMVDDFVECKHGRKAITYLHPLLADVLEETYGVMVYQEQVMKVVQVLAGFTLGQADLLRRAIGKKIPEVLAEQRNLFVEGSAKNDVNPKTAGEIFDLIDYFAGYGFNKSHSAAYALISYQTAYLKANYPVEFMASLMTCELNKPEAIVKLIGECKEMKIEVMPPNINSSDLIFTAKGKKIYFGMAAIKNVGSAALTSIIEARGDGSYTDLTDLFTRIDASKVNSRVMEALTKSGVFDELEPNRHRIFESIDMLLSLAQAEKSMKRENQVSFFDQLPEEELGKSKKAIELPDLPNWKPKERLQHEKEALGFYISGHPAEPYMREIKAFAKITPSYEIKDGEKTFKKREHLRIAGVIATKNIRMTKTGKYMAILQVDDPYGSIEVVVFPKLYADVEALISTDEPLLIKGFQNNNNSSTGLVADTITSLPALRAQHATRMKLHIKSNLEEEKLIKLKEIFERHPGNCLIQFKVDADPKTVHLKLPLRVSPNEQLVESVEEVTGLKSLEFVIEYKPEPTQPKEMPHAAAS